MAGGKRNGVPFPLTSWPDLIRPSILFKRWTPGKPGGDGVTLPTKRKIPPSGGTFLLSPGPAAELAILVGVILVGVLALTVRILLLLAGLLATALLLTGLLARILVLLAGLVLIGHLKISLVERSRS
jgi:hypothetical protein